MQFSAIKRATPSNIVTLALRILQMASLLAIAKSFLCWLKSLPTFLVIQAVRFYQRGISPLIGARCKFHPTCSQYFIEAIQKYGLISGSCRGVYRILRCNPWSRGGVDPP